MATRRRVPMVGDTPAIVVQTEAPRLEVTLRVRTEVSSFNEAEEFDWVSWAELMIAALIIPRSVEGLVDYWKANVNMLDWSKKVQPEIYEEIRTAFAGRKKQLQGGQDG